MSEKKTMAKVLRWVNEVRAEDGKPPLKRLPHGRPAEPRGCVLGRALEGWVELYTVRKGPFELEAITLLPDFVHEFRWRFDAGMYPSLVGAPEPLELLEEVTDCFPDFAPQASLSGARSPITVPTVAGQVVCQERPVPESDAT